MKSEKKDQAQALSFGCERFWCGEHSKGAQLSSDAHWISGNSCLGEKKTKTTLKACSCFSKIKFSQ